MISPRDLANRQEDPERRYTLQQAAELLAFPSVDALKMCLSRNPDLSTPRYRSTGLRRFRLLVQSELDAISRRTETRVKVKLPRNTARNTARNTVRNTRAR